MRFSAGLYILAKYTQSHANNIELLLLNTLFIIHLFYTVQGVSRNLSYPQLILLPNTSKKRLCISFWWTLKKACTTHRPYISLF